MQENLVTEGHRTLIFAQTRKMLDIIQVHIWTTDLWYLSLAYPLLGHLSSFGVFSVVRFYLFSCSVNMILRFGNAPSDHNHYCQNRIIWRYLEVIPFCRMKFLIEDGFSDVLTAPSRQLIENNVCKFVDLPHLGSNSCCLWTLDFIKQTFSSG